jgi:NhaP-type Na+/H+ or K+/H+ antiporter
LKPEHVLFSLAAVLLLGVGAQWLSWRLRLPSILLLLAFGFLAGPLPQLVNPEWILLQPDRVFGDLLLPFVALSVAVILFEGGLNLDLRELT